MHQHLETLLTFNFFPLAGSQATGGPFMLDLDLQGDRTEEEEEFNIVVVG